MISLKSIVSFFIVLYTLAIFLAMQDDDFSSNCHLMNLSSVMQSTNEAINNGIYGEVELPEEFDPRQKIYEFSNKTLALDILTQLDVYKHLNNQTLIEMRYDNISSNKTLYGLRKDEEYCNKHRELFVKYPEAIFDERNVYLARNRTIDIYSILVPGFLNPVQLDRYGSKNFTIMEDFKPYINLFYTAAKFFKYYDIGKHYSCLTQTSNHVPGSNSLGQKNLVAEASKEYLAGYVNRPHCLDNNKLFPDSWLMHRKDQCEAFFKIINDPAYFKLREERKIVYILKIPGAHRGEGVQPLNAKVEKKLRILYAGGDKCGEIKEECILQDYIHNPLLLNGNKFDFRMYMVVASVNPLIVYYHDGFLRVSLVGYDADSGDKKSLLTNLALTHEIADDATRGELFNGMTAEEVKVAQRWSFDRLQEYLLEQGKITDPNWLDNYLRPALKRAMIHLTRLGIKNYFVHSSLYEFFGVDFMLDDDLKLWFIEANDSPAFSHYSIPMRKFIVRMHRNHLKLVFAYLRSRAKRIVEFVNEIIADGDYNLENGKVQIKDLEAKRATFEQITKNYFEKEYEPTPDNEFVKIVDESKQGAEIYQGILSKDCL